MAARALRVLLVEDCPTDARLARDVFTRAVDEPHVVEVVETLAAALERLAVQGADLVLLDLGLPDSRGVETLTALRREAPDVPVVVLTGLEDPEVAEAALREGAQDFVPKSDLGGELLARTVRHTLERAGFQRELRSKSEELRLSEERFRKLVDSVADGIVVVDRVGVVRFANPAAEELLGQDARTLVGQPFGAPVRGDGGAAVRIDRPDGRRVLAEMRVGETTWEGRPVQLATLRDVTLREDAQQALRLEREQTQRQLAQADRMASVGMLAAGVAHEVNNPLTYVLCNLETLTDDLPAVLGLVRDLRAVLSGRRGGVEEVLERSVPDDLESCAGEALDGARRVRDIVRDLKTFARVEPERRVPVALPAVLDSALNMAFNEIKHRAGIERDYGGTPPVVGSEGRICQVFLNLLVNAAHAIEPGDVGGNEIRVRSWTEEGFVVTEVADTGTGIDPANVDRLFDPFFTTKPVGVGSGLGLSVCHSIITSYGGSIEIDSTPGEGTSVLVRLRVSTGDEEDRRRTVTVVPPPGAVRARILVVDDELLVTRMLARALRREYEVATAGGGLEAERLLLADPERFDLVLCDLMMPDLTGMELYDRLAERSHLLADKMVFMTGGTLSERAGEFLDRVPNAHLHKPFDTEELRRLFREILVPEGGCSSRPWSACVRVVAEAVVSAAGDEAQDLAVVVQTVGRSLARDGDPHPVGALYDLGLQAQLPGVHAIPVRLEAQPWPIDGYALTHPLPIITVCRRDVPREVGLSPGWALRVLEVALLEHGTEPSTRTWEAVERRVPRETRSIPAGPGRAADVGGLVAGESHGGRRMARVLVCVVACSAQRPSHPPVRSREQHAREAEVTGVRLSHPAPDSRVSRTRELPAGLQVDVEERVAQAVDDPTAAVVTDGEDAGRLQRQLDPLVVSKGRRPGDTVGVRPAETCVRRQVTHRRVAQALQRTVLVDRTLAGEGTDVRGAAEQTDAADVPLVVTARPGPHDALHTDRAVRTLLLDLLDGACSTGLSRVERPPAVLGAGVDRLGMVTAPVPARRGAVCGAARGVLARIADVVAAPGLAGGRRAVRTAGRVAGVVLGHPHLTAAAGPRGEAQVPAGRVTEAACRHGRAAAHRSRDGLARLTRLARDRLQVDRRARRTRRVLAGDHGRVLARAAAGKEPDGDDRQQRPGGSSAHDIPSLVTRASGLASAGVSAARHARARRGRG